jgi:hypothetical protein
MNKLLLAIVLFLSAASSLFGQVKKLVECPYPDEKISIPPVHPKLIEKYDPAAAKVFMFEEGFKDTISIWVADKLIFKKYMKSDAEGGFADRANIKVKPKTEVTFRMVEQGCTRFRLKKGYKYIYVQRDYNNGQWGLTYSNYRRGYW